MLNLSDRSGSRGRPGEAFSQEPEAAASGGEAPDSVTLTEASWPLREQLVARAGSQRGARRAFPVLRAGRRLWLLQGWESGGARCEPRAHEVYFKQFCRTCPKSSNPYRVEDVTCQSSKQSRRSCPVKLCQFHPKRLHPHDWCRRCAGNACPPQHLQLQIHRSHEHKKGPAEPVLVADKWAFFLLLPSQNTSQKAVFLTSIKYCKSILKALSIAKQLTKVHNTVLLTIDITLHNWNFIPTE